MPLTVYAYWLKDHNDDLMEAWDIMGDVEQFEEGGFTEFCKKQYEADAFDDICRECGNIPASGACFACKMD